MSATLIFDLLLEYLLQQSRRRKDLEKKRPDLGGESPPC